MAQTFTTPQPARSYALPLVLAWLVVAIPLLWGIGQTWINVSKLLATPPSATAAAPSATK